MVREGDEPFRCVDGELLEMALGMGKEVWEGVVREVRGGVGEERWGRVMGGGAAIGGGDGKGGERLRGLVEGLRRLS